MSGENLIRGYTVERFDAVEWDSLAPGERVRHCRIMGEEAAKLASHASPALLRMYRDLEKNWNALGDEMERELVGERSW